MTNEEVRNLRAGDVISDTVNGRTRKFTLCGGGTKVQCSNEKAGAFGHWAAANVETPSGTGHGWISSSVQSDEYLNASGYPTHQDGVRIRGFELLHKATDEESREAASKSSDARR